MKKTRFSQYLPLAIIFGLGLFLRLYRLNLNIPPLYADETGQYFLLQSIVGNTTGLLQGLINHTITFTWFLGLTPLGVRLPSALYGSLLVLVAYFLGLAVSGGNKKVSLIGSLLTAVLPWDYMLSRIGHTPVQVVLLFTGLHLIFFLRATRIKDYFLSLLPLGLALLYYPSILFVLPFVFLHFVFLVYHLATKKYRHLFLLSFLSLVIAFGTFYSVKYNLFSKTNRGMDMAIWNDVNTPYLIDKYRALTWTSQPTIFSFNLPSESLANKLVYNRPQAYFSTFLHNYASFFSADWLFLKGDAILRHSTGQVGALLPFLAPFMVYGIFVFFQTASRKTKTIFLIWIFSSPFSAAITNDGAGYILRAITMMPFLTYFCALGLVESFVLIKRGWQFLYGLLILLIGLYSAYYFFYGYFHVYPSLSARSYEYGFKELSDFQTAHGGASMLIIWNGYYHNNDFRFWQQTPFDEYQSFKKKDIVVGQSHFNQTFSNLYFVNPYSLKDVQTFLKENKINYVVLSDRYYLNYPPEIDKAFISPIIVIKYPDQTPALQIFSTSPFATEKVSRVIDGDTFEMTSGSRIRLIGVDTPEIKNKEMAIDCFALEAKKKLDSLIAGKVVTLEKDVSEMDKYGRLLRYVYLDGEMVNETLVKEGFARLSTFPPDIKYAEKFLGEEKLARQQGLGLWRVCPLVK